MNKQVLAHFWAPWCEPCQHMDQLLAVHAESCPGVRFVRVEAEALPELSERYEVAAVPFFVALKGGAVAASLEGADAEALDAMVVAHFGGAQNGAAKKPMSLNERLAGLIASHPVMLFMKGSPAEPRCVPGGGAGGGSGSRGGGDHCTEDLTRSAPPGCVRACGARMQVRLQPEGGGRPQRHGGGVWQLRHSLRPGRAAGPEGVLRLAHVSAALRQGGGEYRALQRRARRAAARRRRTDTARLLSCWGGATSSWTWRGAGSWPRRCKATR